MKIAVLGAGAIGSLVAGYLKLDGQDVSLVGHAEAVKAITQKGLAISGVRGDFSVNIDCSAELTCKPDLIILATKTQDIPGALENNIKYSREACLLTTQNGIKADEICGRYIGKENLISSIVMFGATYLEPGEVMHNFEGSWIIAKLYKKNDEKVTEVSRVLNKIFPTIVADDLLGMKYLKIFVNANNCIPAILGLSMQEAFQDTEISKISIAIWREGLEIVNKGKIKLQSLPDFSLDRLLKLTAMPPAEAAKIFSGIMANLSKEPLWGSILQSIKRGKTSEIDYINGEFVSEAEKNNADCRLNKKLVEMVHKVEEAGKFFTKEELLSSVKGLYN